VGAYNPQMNQTTSDEFKYDYTIPIGSLSPIGDKLPALPSGEVGVIEQDLDFIIEFAGKLALKRMEDIHFKIFDDQLMGKPGCSSISKFLNSVNVLLK
jgi:hypothetical protein